MSSRPAYHSQWTNQAAHGTAAPMPDEMDIFAPDASNERDLRRAFARFGTGVTVVTAQTQNGPVAMTANSFTSISLDPPLILWSPAKASKRHAAFVNATRFCVHVLAADQLPMALHFAKHGDQFDAYDWSVSAQDLPVLPHCLAVFHCETDAVYSAGDHSLVLGLVTGVNLSHSTRTGLIFADGTYGKAAPFDVP